MIPVPLAIPNNPQLQGIINSLSANGMSVTHTSTVPTAATILEGQMVIYDNGSGTKRLYVVTGQGNLGYIALS